MVVVVTHIADMFMSVIIQQKAVTQNQLYTAFDTLILTANDSHGHNLGLTGLCQE